jgi:hypothetical protein
MSIQSKRELEVTREKLRGLEELYGRTAAAPVENPHTRELTLQSLQRTINQLKEEIVRFQAHTAAATPGDAKS